LFVVLTAACSFSIGKPAMTEDMREQKKFEAQQRAELARNESSLKAESAKLDADEAADRRETEARQAAEQKDAAQRELARQDAQTRQDAAREDAEFNHAFDTSTRQSQRAEREAMLLARHHAEPLAVGVFEWAKAGYSRGDGCEFWESNRLSISVDEKGTASWSAFVSSDGRCATGQVAPSNCGQSGVGFIEQVEGTLRLVTTARARFGGEGAPPAMALWRCGSLTVRAPMSWEPSASGQCVRLGSEPDRAVEIAGGMVCQYVELFPELTDPGVQITVTRDQLSFVDKKRVLNLKRKKAEPTASPP
jgi:hypothetical protein